MGRLCEADQWAEPSPALMKNMYTRIVSLTARFLRDVLLYILLTDHGRMVVDLILPAALETMLWQ